MTVHTSFAGRLFFVKKLTEEQKQQVEKVLHDTSILDVHGAGNEFDSFVQERFQHDPGQYFNLCLSDDGDSIEWDHSYKTTRLAEKVKAFCLYCTSEGLPELDGRIEACVEDGKPCSLYKIEVKYGNKVIRADIIPDWDKGLLDKEVK